jgi:perosamine synthetase
VVGRTVCKAVIDRADTKALPRSAPAVHHGVVHGHRSLPKSPVLDWSDFQRTSASQPRGVADLEHVVYTSSGRAALHAALQHMRLEPGSLVLVPTYHCPTMVAPIVDAGHRPHFYALDELGLPALDRIRWEAQPPRAMFVAHFFGLARSLKQVRSWCDRHGIVLVEDCAHSCFGSAGERIVGGWGDYAITSLSKFYPVPEAGLLASASRAVELAGVVPSPLRRQAKAWWDVLHVAHDHGRLAGLSHALHPIVALRRSKPQSFDAAFAEAIVHTSGHATQADMVDGATRLREIHKGCDMARVGEHATFAARWLHRRLPAASIVSARRRNFAILHEGLTSSATARPLSLPVNGDAAPYVMPLHVPGVARADRVYALMREQGLPVFRWDRLWPGTPVWVDDAGVRWSREVIQLLCHQSLSRADVEHVLSQTQRILAQTPDA